MGHLEDGTWEYLRDRGLWHFDPLLAERPSSHRILGRISGDLSRLWIDVPPGETKTLARSMEHRSPGDFYGRVQRGNEADARRYGFDPEQSYAEVYDAKGRDRRVDLVDEVVASFPLDGAYWKLHRQRPGQIWPVHVDNYHALAEGGRQAEEWLDPGVRRLIVMLTPWSWGQAFFVGNRVWSNWEPGEILYMDWLVPHGSANCGHDDRISLVITGFVTEEFERWVHGDARMIAIPQ